MRVRVTISNARESLHRARTRDHRLRIRARQLGRSPASRERPGARASSGHGRPAHSPRTTAARAPPSLPSLPAWRATLRAISGSASTSLALRPPTQVRRQGFVAKRRRPGRRASTRSPKRPPQPPVAFVALRSPPSFAYESYVANAIARRTLSSPPLRSSGPRCPAADCAGVPFSRLIDLSSDFGARAARHLREETVVWLTTR